MLSSSILLLRWAIGFVFGTWLIHKTRHTWKKIVLGLTPMRYRISEKSYQVVKRIYLLVKVLLIIFVATVVSKGLYQLTTALEVEGISKVQTVIPSIPKIDFPVKTPIPTEYSPVPTAEVIAPPAIRVDTVFIPAPSQKSDIQALAPTNFKSTYNTRRLESEAPSVPYFVQLYAFSQLDKAVRARQKWSHQLAMPCWLGLVERDASPYKLLVGPFVSKRIARRFLLERGIKGFPRKGDAVQLFEPKTRQ